MNRLSRVGFVVLLLLGVSCAGESSAQKIELRIDSSSNSAFVRELEGTMKGTLSIRAGGAEERQTLIREERRVFEDEILASEGGQIMKVRRKIREWTLRRQGPGEPAPVDVSPKLVGRTIVMTRTELGTEHEGAEGASEDELRANSIDALDALLSLPSHPVSVGDTWEIDGDHLVAVFGGDGQRGMKVRGAKGTGRLGQLETSGAHRLAVVAIKFEATGALRLLLDVGVEIKGEGLFRLDPLTRRLLSFQIVGTGTLSGEVERPSGPAVYEGSFTFDVRGKSTPR
jgi:hypothetical protein